LERLAVPFASAVIMTVSSKFALALLACVVVAVMAYAVVGVRSELKAGGNRCRAEAGERAPDPTALHGAFRAVLGASDRGYRARDHVKAPVLRAVIEVSFIVFLFYANLLMGEYEGSGMGPTKGLAWAMTDIVTARNFAIALAAAVAGHFVFESLRKRLP
jgi:hypothetical protein